MGKMTGWKTKTGAVITMIGSLYGMYNGSISVVEGLQAIGAALMAVGIGHKIEKSS